jgi:hypothetical protein
MVVFRLVAALTLFAIAGCVGMWLLTGDRRYLSWALRLVKTIAALALVFFGLLFLERII